MRNCEYEVHIYHRKQVVSEKRIPDLTSLRFHTSRYQTGRLLDIDPSGSEGKPDVHYPPESTTASSSN
jgi:hypothetical protein